MDGPGPPPIASEHTNRCAPKQQQVRVALFSRVPEKCLGSPDRETPFKVQRLRWGYPRMHRRRQGARIGIRVHTRERRTEPAGFNGVSNGDRVGSAATLHEVRE
ncbi:MAG: hypothetical protein Tsb0013_07480 [Phycisphaerales bacterium]